MESIQGFSKGMIKDTSTLSQSKDSYLNAKNLRLITLSGQSNFTIENVKGNSLSSTLPDTSAIYKFVAGAGYGDDPTEVYTITIDSITPLTTSAINTGLKTLADTFNAHSAFTSLGFVAHYSSAETELYITSTSSTVISSITITMASGHILTKTTNLASQTNLIPIGFTTIRDDIYIFSTNDTSSTGGAGQIWKLTYDKTTYAATLLLKYNAAINLTTQHPIPPTAIEGRYETTNIQRIYWSDNFNPPRNINVQADNLFALDSTLIDAQPELDLSIPILQKINPNGNLDVGVYQAAYRLKKTGGATTDFSQLSNQVYIVNDEPEADNVDGFNFQTFISDAQNTASNKSITWKITNIDTDYDRIELAVAFRENLNGTPIIAIVKDDPIDSTGTVTITYNGNETDITTISLQDLTTTAPYISKVKTIGTKDNRLIYGNVSIASKSLDEYDTRAYRFNSSGDASITDKGITTTPSSATLLADNFVLDETNDAIQNHTSNILNSSGVIGGTGYNISYEFGVYVIAGDTTVQIDTDGDGIQTAPYRVNYSPDVPSINLGITGQDYALNGFNESMGSPYISSIFKSCKRGEIYRWGIQFFDKAGAPLFTKWIGDIKMPSMFDSIVAANRLNKDGSVNGDSVTDFRLSYIDASGVCKIQIPYIKFTVSNLNTIADEIGGYSFVRVERKEEDKTILGQGLVHMTFRKDADELMFPNLTTYLSSSGNVTAPVDGTNTETDTGTIQIPEFLFNGYPGYEDGDELQLISVNTPSNTEHDIRPDAAGTANSYIIEKMYAMARPTVTSSFDIEEALEVGFAQSATITNYGTYRNYDNQTFVGIDAPGTVGSKTLYFRLDSELGYSTILTTDSRNRFLAEYRRTVASQYGGNTYSARAANTYISVGHFQPYTGENSYTTNVLGGDIFTNIYDCQRGIKNGGVAISGKLDTGATKISLTDYFAVETTVGTEWRSGIHVNRNLIIDAATDPEFNAYFETFDYNSVFDSEPNLRFYTPKPEDFQDVTEFDTRFYASEIKINGDAGDSWTIFRANEYWDVEGSYGPINSMIILRDKMFFLQDRAFGVLSINPRSLITDSDGQELTLGTGEVLQRHDYISTEVGCKHQWAVTKSSNSLFFFDINTKKFYKFDQGLNQLSDTKGMASYFYNNLNGNINTIDNPIYNNPTLGINGITCVYDFRFNEAIFTFLDNTTKYTLAFNDQINAFTGFYDYTPGLYITDGKQIFSPNPSDLNTIYLHEDGDYGKFYETIYPSKLTIVSNDNPTYKKVFDNVVMGTEALVDGRNISTDTWKEIRVYNDYQNTDFQLLDPLSLNPNIKLKERNWQLAVPRNRVKYTSSSSPNIFTDLETENKLFGERIRDKYATIDLNYDNLNNYQLKTHFIKILYRLSDR